MNTSRYEIFLKVVETGSITKTARYYGYSQPGISYILNTLENDIGFSLLIRSKNSVFISPEGKELLPIFRKLSEDESEFRQKIRELNRLNCGTIRIGALNSTILHLVPKVISAYSSAFSKIHVYLNEGSIPELSEQLKNNNIDLAFTTNKIPSGFNFIPLMKDPLYLIVNSKHPFASFEKIPPSLLNGCNFIVPVDGWDDAFKEIQKTEKFTPNPVQYIASDAAAIAMVSGNVGVYVASVLQTNNLPDNVIAKPFTHDVYRILGICIRSIKNASPAIRTFINTAKSQASILYPDRIIE